ncbi:phosphopantetheine-binding protein [Candidatus Pelagibacter sp.]|nr:phosphopantetheine-binding protein [Candidatus Pelagibacter sp.]
MIKNKKIEKDLINLIKEKTTKKINLDTDLLEMEIVDSLFFVEVISFLKKKYKINIPMNIISIEDFISVKKIMLLIKKISA